MPFLTIIKKIDGSHWVTASFNILEPLAICKTLQTATLIATCMAATGRYNFFY